MTTGNLQYSNAIVQSKAVSMKDAERFEQEGENIPDPENPATPEGKPTDDNVDWKKRFGDQQTYINKIKNDHKSELESIKTQLADLQKQREEDKKFSYPATEEELSDWKSNFPKVHDIFRTIARKEFEETLVAKDKEINDLKTMLTSFGEKQGRLELKKFHPDAEEIENSPEFELWLSSKRPSIQQLARGTVEDVKELLDLYKNEMGLTEAAKRQQNKEASKVVATNSSANLPADKKVWKESDLMRITNSKELERALVEFEKARLEGRVEYDLSSKQISTR